MSIERLELPDEFEGLPNRVIERAQSEAEAMLPGTLVPRLGQARAEAVLTNATAHVLYVTKAGTTEPPLAVPLDRWSASPYGQQVATTLALLSKPTGRTRAFPISSSEP